MVLSSAWRLGSQRTVVLQDVFEEETGLALPWVGSTGRYVSIDGGNNETRDVTAVRGRCHEIKEYVRTHFYEDTRWVAVDDLPLGKAMTIRDYVDEVPLRE